MPSNNSINELGFLRLDGRRKSPLFRQLYESIRTAILDGRLKPNARIPSSRTLVDQLGVSRTTVVTAIDLLISEGYLKTAVGSGTFVSKEIPNDRPFVNSAPTQVGKVERPTPADPDSYFGISGKKFLDFPLAGHYIGTPKPFCPGEPALDDFPTNVWAKIVRRVWNTISPLKLSYGEAAGALPLRKSIAEYLRAHRGVRCETEQVMIVSGTQQAVDIVARISINPGDKVLFENPGYISAREVFTKQGAKIVPMDVDEHGAVTGQAIHENPDTRLIYVTPSHQYPLGVTLPIERRLELIQWAGETNGLILEDDYDSEYRYAQKPIPCMQGLDSSDRTIYVGSFSKVIFPGLGLGYAIVPPDMVEVFKNALRITSRPASQVDQLVLNEFIREGHFSRHIRRMRKTHAERREVFVEEVEKHLSGRLKILGSQAGLHCATILQTGQRDLEVAENLQRAGIISRPLSYYYMPEHEPAERLNGLVFGFACATPAQIRKGIRTVSELL